MILSLIIMIIATVTVSQFRISPQDTENMKKLISDRATTASFGHVTSTFEHVLIAHPGECRSNLGPKITIQAINCQIRQAP